jgi:2-methylisocitrate lyase-like PEP mutase family enzyme
MEGKAVIDAEEMVQKLHAAVEARRDPDFVICARTDAIATHGVDEAIRRGKLYAQAGLGVLILQYNANLDIASVYSLFVVLAVIGLTLHLTMRWLERRFCFWAQRSKQDPAREVV